MGQIRVLFDETNKLAILGLANEGSEEKIVHQVRIKLKADRVENNWTVKAIPAALLTLSLEFRCLIPCPNIIQLVHIIATKNITGIGPVTAFVNVEAKIGLTDRVEQIIARLGNPAVPVVCIFVNENGVWDAKAACPASGCPGGLSPREFAKKIAEEMGYPVGKKYDPDTDPPPIFFWWFMR